MSEYDAVISASCVQHENLGLLRAKKVNQLSRSNNVPMRIILKPDLPCRTLPVPYLASTGIDPLVMIIPFSHSIGHVWTLLEVYPLPCTHLAVDILETQWVKGSLGCRFATNIRAVGAS